LTEYKGRITTLTFHLLTLHPRGQIKLRRFARRAYEAFFSARKSANLSDSVQQQLNKYSLAAAAAGVGLVLGQPAEAKIVYTPADTNITPDHTIPLDLNHDGIVDFGFKDVYRKSRTYGFDHTGVLSVLPANPANKVEGFTRVNGNYASALRAGASIGPNAEFTVGPNRMEEAFIDTGRDRT
jgi:hypothetical protein